MKRVFIIAEAGVNHNGDLAIARRLVDAAKEAGADAVKFQTFKANALVTKTARKAGYQIGLGEADKLQHEMLQSLELDEAAHAILAQYCRTRGIEFLSSAFDSDGIRILRSLGLHKWKVPSGEISNLPFLRTIGAFGDEVILSTGMATLGEVESAIAAITQAGTERSKITVLHCTTEYPAPYDEINLRAMLTMGEAFQVRIGYSDHTLGIEVPIAAVALGATLIEKHFTLDRLMEGPDHRASLEPEDLKAMVTAIRNVERALGSRVKYPGPAERKNLTAIRKSIVAARIIRTGETLSEDNLVIKRPGDGISPMEWDRVIGRRAARQFEPDEKIEL